MNKKLLVAVGLVGVAATVLLTGCTSDADRASENLSTAAEQFEVNRRITFINGITDHEMLVIEGRCSVETANSALAGSLEVTCKIGPDEYKKNYLYLSDNVTATIEQLDPVDVSVYNYRFVIKPQNLFPNIDIQGGNQ